MATQAVFDYQTSLWTKLLGTAVLQSMNNETDVIEFLLIIKFCRMRINTILFQKFNPVSFHEYTYIRKFERSKLR